MNINIIKKLTMKKINNSFCRISIILIASLLLASCSSGGGGGGNSGGGGGGNSGGGGGNSGGGGGGNSGGGIPSNVNIDLNASNDNGTITLSATITNNTNATIDSALLELHRNNDIIATADIGTLLPKSLPSSTTDRFQLATSDTPTTFGDYAYMLCVRDASSTNPTCSPEKTFALFPDLALTAFSLSAERVSPNTPFTLLATFINQGTRFSTSATLEFQRSTTDSFSSSTILPTTNIARLSTNKPTIETISTSIDATGTYYYRACLRDVTGEQVTNNNCSLVAQVEVIANEFNILLGATNDNGTIHLATTITNIGNATIDSALLEYQRNDAVFSTININNLSPKASVTEVTSDAPTTAGNYIYKVCVQGATICSPAQSFALFPDLALTAFSASAEKVSPNTDFALTAIFINQGKRFSTSATLEYQRSTTTDFTNISPIATTTIRILAVNTTNDGRAFTRVDVTGDYYYRACVSDVIGERMTDNNCSEGIKVVIQSDEGGGIIPNQLNIVLGATNDNGTINLAATITNNSGATIDSALLEYQRNDAIFSTTDIDDLSPNASVTETRTDTPTTFGDYAYKVCVRDASNTNSICSPERPFFLFPDLAVIFTTNEARVYSNRDFTLNAEITNGGSRFSQNTILDFQRSTTQNFTNSIILSTTDIAGLSVNDSTNNSFTANEETQGIYYYRACVRNVAGDSNNNNNCSGAQTVEIIPVRLSVALTANNNNGEIDLSASITNENDIPVEFIVLEFYRNEVIFATSDIGSVGSSPIAEAMSDIPTTAGTYIYKVCAKDTQTGREFCSPESPESTFALFPDLIISLSSSITNENANADFSLIAQITNAGTGFSTSAILEYQRSSEEDFSSNTIILGTTNIANLSVNNPTNDNLFIPRESALGAFYYRACVQNVTGEQNTNNNCSTPIIRIEIIAAPDLTISQFTVNLADNTKVGTKLTMKALVKNIGLADANATNIQYYRSRDSQISHHST